MFDSKSSIKIFFIYTLIIFLSNFVLSQTNSDIHQIQQEQHRNKFNPIGEKVSLLTGLDILLSQQIEIIQNKSIALVTNHTGTDKNGIPNYIRLMEIESVDLKVVFSPEHGLFGEAAAGEKVTYTEKKRDLPRVVSLYGKLKKPTKSMLADIDLILYDIQDIGARFYTYISTLGLIMETAGELKIPIIVLDRPNPIRGDRIEGPILNMDYKSFVGYYPIPIQYGLTIGELANVIVKEKWIPNSPKLQIIKLQGWSRDLWFDDTNLSWVKPSPNIPDLETAIIYPGVCLVEGTNMSEGRGTLNPFKIIGAPWINGEQLSQELNSINLSGVIFKPAIFTPVEIPNMAIKPKYMGEKCSGIEITVVDRNIYKSISVGVHLISTVQSLYPDSLKFLTSIDRLWGSNSLATHIKSNKPANVILTLARDQFKNYLKKIRPYKIY